MSNVLETLQDAVKAADRRALEQQEDTIAVASQWAQEKLENFISEVESSGDDRKLLPISHIISCRTSIDIFQSNTSEIGKFAGTLISKLIDGNFKEAFSGLAETILDKLLGASAGSAQTERIYEVMFDELGGLNRLDAYFFCYRFSASGLSEFGKAIIGTCVIRSAALMVDDNAYRVVLTSSATLEAAQRAQISASMVNVAKNQKYMLNERKELVPSESALLEARAELAGVIGEGVAISPQYEKRKTGAGGSPTFSSSHQKTGAEENADKIHGKITTLSGELTDKPAATAPTPPKQIEA
ncbi:hypothetical protein DL98DRAFT_611827 [Cadophora sp. DSE1049]|nr:hypothetical protein DL98DRAFT_611827 [Cadophora sp. DSE1049]